MTSSLAKFLSLPDAQVTELTAALTAYQDLVAPKLADEGFIGALPDASTSVLALHGKKGAPGYELLHSKDDNVAKAANKVFENEEASGKSAVQAQAAIVKIPKVESAENAGNVSAQPISGASAPSGAPSAEHVSTKGWQKVGPRAGSNPGGLFQTPAGEKYYVKASKSDLHAQNEALASKLYALAGLSGPEVKLADLDQATLGSKQLGIVSKIIPGQSNLRTAYKTPQGRADSADGMAVHAWISNWDAAGLGKDNMVTKPDGHLSVVDVGGSLLFRAQGGPKGGAFGNSVGEVDTLRNPNMNPDAYDVFGQVTNDDIAKSVAAHIAPVTEAAIDQAVDSTISDKAIAMQLKATIKARRLDLMQRFPASKAA